MTHPSQVHFTIPFRTSFLSFSTAAGFVFKKGKARPFSAFLTLNPKGKIGWEFPPREAKGKGKPAARKQAPRPRRLDRPPLPRLLQDHLADAKPPHEEVKRPGVRAIWPGDFRRCKMSGRFAEMQSPWSDGKSSLAGSTRIDRATFR